MLQEAFNWLWFVLFIVICLVRKVHEHNAGQYSGLKGISVAEAVLMILWGIAAGVLPLFYIFGSWLDFADLPFRMHSAFGFSGIVLFLISIWLLHRSHTDLGKLWSPTVEPDAKHALVTDGIYKRIRHPMYAAHLLWGVAQALILPNLIAGPLAFVLMLGVIALRVPREELTLLGEFGDDYSSYMKETGRIFPKLNM